MSSPKVKLAVSMSPALVERLKAVVLRGRTRSVSAYVEHAVAAQLAAEADFDGLIEQALAETGGPWCIDEYQGGIDKLTVPAGCVARVRPLRDQGARVPPGARQCEVRFHFSPVRCVANDPNRHQPSDCHHIEFRVTRSANPVIRLS